MTIFAVHAVKKDPNLGLCSAFKLDIDFTKTFKTGEIDLHVPIRDEIFSADTRFIVTIIPPVMSDDAVGLHLLCDALRRLNPTAGAYIELFMPYYPYSRQDRTVISDGMIIPNALMAFTGIIKAVQPYRVVTCDMHSMVGEALWSPQVYRNLEPGFDLEIVLPPNAFIVAPDAGASKKVAAIAKLFPDAEFVQFNKQRHPTSGFLEVALPSEDVVQKLTSPGAMVYIFDDICDGGRTFTQIADALRSKAVSQDYELHLRVTHGFFTSGKHAVKEKFDSVEAIFDYSDSEKLSDTLNNLIRSKLI